MRAVATTATRRPTPPRSTATTDKADKREVILTAATKVFARHGFFNAQVAD